MSDEIEDIFGDGEDSAPSNESPASDVPGSDSPEDEITDAPETPDEEIELPRIDF